MSQGVVCQPPNYVCCTKYPDMLTRTHLISDFLCDRYFMTYFQLGHPYHCLNVILFSTILAFLFRPFPTVCHKASPLACPKRCWRLGGVTTSSSLPLEARARLLSLSSRTRCLRSRSSCGRSLSLSLLLSLFFALVIVLAAAASVTDEIWHANGEAL